MMTTWLASSSASSRYCVVSSTSVPWATSARVASHRSIRLRGSNPDVGSSSKSNRGAPTRLAPRSSLRRIRLRQSDTPQPQPQNALSARALKASMVVCSCGLCIHTSAAARGVHRPPRGLVAGDGQRRRLTARWESGQPASWEEGSLRQPVMTAWPGRRGAVRCGAPRARTRFGRGARPVGLSGVNPVDTKKRRWWLGAEMPFPRVIPHSDGAGVVEAVGEGGNGPGTETAAGRAGRGPPWWPC
jgi:hypothetical protein